jgi:hypothetical protein
MQTKAKVGRPSRKITWPQDRPFTLKEVASRYKNIGQSMTMQGLGYRVDQDVANGILQEVGNKPRPKGTGAGRPQKLYQVVK